MNTLIWQLAECKCSVYSPFSLCLKVSICTRKGTPFSPPCFLGVNSVLMQCTCGGCGRQLGGGPEPPGTPPPVDVPTPQSDPPPPPRCPPAPATPSGHWPTPTASHFHPLTLEALPDQLSPCHYSRPTDPSNSPSLLPRDLCPDKSQRPQSRDHSVVPRSLVP